MEAKDLWAEAVPWEAGDLWAEADPWEAEDLWVAEDRIWLLRRREDVDFTADRAAVASAVLH